MSLFREELYVRPYPGSIQEHIEHSDSMERRAEAIRRHHSRMQAEMFDPPCPNCGFVGGRAIFGVSSDPSTGYYAEEQGCSECIPSSRW